MFAIHLSSQLWMPQWPILLHSGSQVLLDFYHVTDLLLDYTTNAFVAAAKVQVLPPSNWLNVHALSCLSTLQLRLRGLSRLCTPTLALYRTGICNCYQIFSLKVILIGQHLRPLSQHLCRLSKVLVYLHRLSKVQL